MKKLFVFVFLMFAVFGCSKKNDVVKMNSGLMYKDDSTGTGKVAKMGDLVSLEFSGWLVQDSSDLFSDWSKDKKYASASIGSSHMYNRPVKYVLGNGNFIKGLDEGIEGMKEGGTRTIIIPPNLAYGKRGYGPIPPNTSIKLVISLLNIKKVPKVTEWDVDSSKFITTNSGLKYAVLKEGTGPTVKNGDTVIVNYSGFLTDGKKFDSSVERNQPFTFVAGQGQVIKGWDEAVTYLRKGSKAKLIIPPDLGYGEKQVGVIPPNTTLVFDVEILDIK